MNGHAASQRSARIPGLTGGPAALLPVAADAAMELASSGISAHRGDRMGDVPLLRSRVQTAEREVTEALEEDFGHE